MSWERRGSSDRLYYTRFRRVKGRVIREYIGCGQRGEEAAAEDARVRAEREAQREARRAEMAAWQKGQEALEVLKKATDQLMRAALTGAGYYQHARGQWRRYYGR
jgi:hypothetical protein